MHIEIQKLGPADLDRFKELIRLFGVVFEMNDLQMPPDDHLQKILDDDNFFVFVALSAGRVVGGLTSYTLQQYYNTQPLVYIYDLAVQTEFQRQGIGKKLIEEINTYCREAGVEEIFVQADEADDYALDFYQSTGAIAEKVVHFNYPLKNK